MFQTKPLEHGWKMTVATPKPITCNRCLRVAFRRPSGLHRVSGLRQASATVTLQEDTLERVKRGRKVEDLGWEKNYKKINYMFSPCFGPSPTVCFFLGTFGPEFGAKNECS